MGAVPGEAVAKSRRPSARGRGTRNETDIDGLTVAVEMTLDCWPLQVGRLMVTERDHLTPEIGAHTLDGARGRDGKHEETDASESATLAERHRVHH